MSLSLYTLALKRQIFNKWKSQSQFKTVDFQGNEYYLENGIFVIHITQEESKYKYGVAHSSHYAGERKVFEKGYYVLSTKRPNYLIIDDPDVLQFILEFNLN